MLSLSMPTYKLHCTWLQGLALSGIDSDENSRDFENELRKIRPNISDHIYICNDCQGTLFSVTGEGKI